MSSPCARQDALRMLHELGGLSCEKTGAPDAVHRQHIAHKHPLDVGRVEHPWPGCADRRTIQGCSPDVTVAAIVQPTGGGEHLGRRKPPTSALL